MTFFFFSSRSNTHLSGNTDKAQNSFPRTEIWGFMAGKSPKASPLTRNRHVLHLNNTARQSTATWWPFSTAANGRCDNQSFPATEHLSDVTCDTGRGRLPGCVGEEGAGAKYRLADTSRVVWTQEFCFPETYTPVCCCVLFSFEREHCSVVKRISSESLSGSAAWFHHYLAGLWATWAPSACVLRSKPMPGPQGGRWAAKEQTYSARPVRIIFPVLHCGWPWFNSTWCQLYSVQPSQGNTIPRSSISLLLGMGCGSPCVDFPNSGVPLGHPQVVGHRSEGHRLWHLLARWTRRLCHVLAVWPW